MATNAKRLIAPSGRWAIMARTGPTGPWVQVESVLGGEEADRMVRNPEDDRDSRTDYIRDPLDERGSWGRPCGRARPIPGRWPRRHASRPGSRERWSTSRRAAPSATCRAPWRGSSDGDEEGLQGPQERPHVPAGQATADRGRHLPDP